jgi:peptidoglycan hydrolase-like protein with peptidoglycan-binding domain
LSSLQSVDLRSVSTFEIGNAYGRISYPAASSPYVLVRKNGGIDDRLDIDASLDIAQGKVTLDSATLPELNRPAVITLYNMKLTKPAIKKNGAICAGCTLVSYDSGTKVLVFRVEGFSTYEIVDDETEAESSAAAPAGNSGSASTGGGSTGGGGGGFGTFVPSNAQPSAVGQAVACAEGQTFNVSSGKRCSTYPATGASSQYSFSRNLTIGAKGEDVRQLQIFLNTNGFAIASTGAGSKGSESITFGPATQKALARYQASKKIVPASGYFGPATRQIINGGGVSAAQTGTIPAQIAIPSSPSQTAEAILRLGSTGAAVKALRVRLRTLGYLAAYGSAADVPTSAAAETSAFGVATEAALKEFQCDKSIVCTGTAATTGWGAAGTKTRSALGL